MQGTAAVLRRLDAISEQIKKMPKDLTAYAEGLAINMNQEYGNYSYEDDDVSVYVDELPNGCSIVGTGEDIFFVEFGTGLFYSRNPMPHPYNEPASWSATHAQFLTDPKKLAKYHGYWPYNGKWTSGQPSANVFYEAQKTVEQEVPEYAEKVLSRAFT